MELLSISATDCRYFSSGKYWGKNSSFKNKKKSIECALKVGIGHAQKTPGKKGPKIKLADEQQEVLNAVCDKKSIFISGSAGTGKTFLLHHVIKELRKIHGKSGVYVTASTGVAACALYGQTLHSFAGVGLAEVDNKGLVHRVLLNRKALSRWKKVKALIIDEISMVDPRFFDGLAYIAREVRGVHQVSENGNKAWGGIQLIVSGDFFQLPPVLKEKKKDQKVFAFEADSWDESFHVKILLNTIFRQSDSLLVQILQGIREGETNPDHMMLLEGRCSGYEVDPEAVRLYPMISDVTKVNTAKLHSLGAEIYVYNAKDSGKDRWSRQLKSGMATDEIKLCVGARVMLIKNIQPWLKLVNGATGTVVEFRNVSEKDHKLSDMCSHGSVLPVVKFDSGLEFVVEPETWAVMDGDDVVATRRQIPLILSWAISIHKCQGTTLEKLSTDLTRVFDFGMVYVALSRVTSLAGLHLSGLDPSRIKAHPKVLEFYRKIDSERDL